MVVRRDLTVRYFGKDSSGRGLYMTQWMWDVHQAMKRHPLIQPFAYKIVIVQGAFMLRNGGGASASDGFHNYAGCLDVRTWNLTTSEIDKWVWVSGIIGFPYWRRDYTARHGGMAPHAHGILLSDSPLGYGAGLSRASYLSGGDSLAGPGGDYERRPNPKVLYPPDHLMETGWLMPDQADRIEKNTKAILESLNTFRTNEAKRDKEAAIKARESKERIVSMIAGLVDMLNEANDSQDIVIVKRKIAEVQAKILGALADDPDVDGPDNPAPPGG